MLLDYRDLDLLRLIGLCKDIPVDCSPIQSDMFSPASFSALAGTGYIRKSKCGLSYRLTDKGYALLTSLGFPAERDSVPVGNGRTLERRLEVAKTVLSFYRIGFMFDVINEQARYTPAFTFRRKSKGDILGASQLCGIAQFIRQTAPVYFITENTKLNPKVELPAIKRMMALMPGPEDICLILFGDEKTVLDAFINPFDELKQRSLWGDALPVEKGWRLYEPPAEPLEETTSA